MSRWRSALLRSLEIRLLVPLSIVVAVVLAIHAFLGLRSTEERLSGLVRAEVERSSRLIESATHDGMLLNQLDEVQRTLERLGEDPDLMAVRVLDKEGRIALSSDPSELGHQYALDSATCVACHTDASVLERAEAQRQTVVRREHGPDVMRRLTVIENEPSCSTAACHYHPPDHAALGVLDVQMSMAPFDAAISDARDRLVWTTLALIALTGVVAAGFIRLTVHGPVDRLKRGARRVAAGDLDTRIDVRGEHELAHLADVFNRMVADLREARAQVTDWSQNLERMVETKTRELHQAQRQVFHMDKMASLGKLSATVAHELNNPITGILTYARLVARELRDQPIDDASRADLERYLELIDKESARCGAIVHNLLTFSRRKGGAMSAVDVNEAMDRSLMLVRHHLELHGIGLRAEPIEGDATIQADAGQVEQALLALLMNAIEAMRASEAGEKALTVAARGDAGAVTLEVGDTGVGIRPEDLPHVFEPFFSTKGEETGAGLGLGLAVVYGIVKRHGGEIDVDSERGRGTTFRVRLPRSPALDEEADGGGAGVGAAP